MENLLEDLKWFAVFMSLPIMELKILRCWTDLCSFEMLNSVCHVAFPVVMSIL